MPKISFQNENLKMVLTVITIAIIIFGLIGNYYIGNYRLTELEKAGKDRESRLKFVEMQMSQINAKLDILLENVGLINQYKNQRLLRGK
jgi:hypothetical protein